MLNLKLLGTAAGGGFPQWNCCCHLCNGSRTNPAAIPPRRQLQAVFSASALEPQLPGNTGFARQTSQFLINASPDLRFQIESEPVLWPSPSRGSRNSPISAILLTSADLDQVLGLLFLREFLPLTVYATVAVRETLEANSFFRMLHRVPDQLTWIDIAPNTPFLLAGDHGETITCTPVPLSGRMPFYAQDHRPGITGQASIGYVLECAGQRLAYFPSLPEITLELKAIFESCDTILVDGTFWSDEELRQTHPGTPLAREIGHIPLSGEDGTIAQLKSLTKPLKVFIHINNTNPIIDPASREHRLVTDSGWRIANDGWEWKPR